MKKSIRKFRSNVWPGEGARTPSAGMVLLLLGALVCTAAEAQPVPGGSLDPLKIPKYVTPLVIPPVLKNTGADHDYSIAVRQFQQQILPGGQWNTLNGRNDAFPPTTVWSYGPSGDGQPDSQKIGGSMGVAPAPNSQFNYPAFTVETLKDTEVRVEWVNNLVRDPWKCDWRAPKGKNCGFIPHLVTVDRSLHWANPELLACAETGLPATDCRPDPVANGTMLQRPYAGPVSMVPHVHGAHVNPESDGYPEAWWLPTASNIPAGYATQGRLVNQYGTTPTNQQPGIANYTYRNDQPSTTLWYHDHTLGMTRNNVYAGPAGFWLIRESGGSETGLVSGTLPGPAPVAGESLEITNFPAALGGQREKYREIPIVIQDRSFNGDGSLFYPANRAFFEGLGKGNSPGARSNQKAGLDIPFVGEGTSDISAIWNPEAFFNVMVVNGVSWPRHDVEPDLYRFRLLNGCNSRFLNLALVVTASPDAALVGQEVPFYQIGAEQSLLPNVVKVRTGFKTVLPGGGVVPASETPAEAAEEALLLGLAERADVLVDFSSLPAGTVVQMINTAPDAPFGGFPDVPADPSTTGQVMQFVVGADSAVGEGFTAPEDLVLNLPDAADPANSPSAFPGARDLALLEEVSQHVCATIRPDGTILWDPLGIPDPATETCVDTTGALLPSVPFGPKAAVLGINGASGGTVTLWSDPIEQNPALGATETWELWNWSADAHPIHPHLVKFKLVGRQAFDPATGILDPAGSRAPTLTEAGWKDTVIAYPGEVTRLNATFDIAGLYVWHCHILEHEDNEMMVPYCVGAKESAPGCSVVP
jgi:FtsP/CotA-like multicopper oxidase with cupredoxin domain